MDKRFRPAIVLIVLFCLAFSFTTAAGKSYQADRFDVDLVIEEGGRYLVTETVVFQFIGGPYTYAFRQLARDENDRIEILSAAMDGVALPQGSQAGQVEISATGDPIDVRWHFAPTSDQVHTFTLKYRVYGATQLSADADLVKWYVIPSDHEYEIRSSTITVHLPEGNTMSGAIGLSGADWKMELTEMLFTAIASDIPADQEAILTLPFPSGSLLSQPPAWQAVQLERSRQTRDAFPWAAGIGLACLMFDAFWLARYWRNNHPIQAEAFEQGFVTRPPDRLSPAEAGALFSLPAVPLDLAVATLLDLARRGWVRMDQTGKKGFFSRGKFMVVREPVVDDVSLRPHEQTVYDLVFDHQPGHSQIADSVELSKSIERLQRGSRLFSEKISETMLQGQWMDPNRKRQRQRITLLSLMGMILSILAFLLSLGMIGLVSGNRAFGGTLLMGFSIAAFVLDMAGLVMASNWHVLTDWGLKARKQWQGFAEYLKGQVRNRESVLQGEWLDAYLPLAMAFHIGDRWAKTFQDRGIKPELAWLQAVDDLQAADFMACVIASSGGDGAAGGGGGGGGGASGAG